MPPATLRFRSTAVPTVANRLAWFYVYGEWPKQCIDHINRIKTDNRIANLRDVSHKENMANRDYHGRPPGMGCNMPVSAYRYRGRWAARKTVNGVRKWLGIFDTKEQALACETQSRPA